MTSKKTVYTLAGVLGASVLFVAFDDGPNRKAPVRTSSDLASDVVSSPVPKYVSSFHQTYFTNVEYIAGKGLPSGLEDLTLHIFLQIHDGDGMQTDAIVADCQLGIYRQLEALYKEKKISGVFFEGYRIGFDYIDNLGGWNWSEVRIKEKRQELVAADDKKLKAMFQVTENEFGDHNDASELFPVQYGKLPTLLVTGWEDEPLAQKDMIEFGAVITKYGELYHLPHRTETQEQEFNALEPQALALVARHQDRTRQAYDNSLVAMANIFAAYPSLPHGYAVINGAGHADDLSLHGSAQADITSKAVYPNAKIYRCKIE